MNDEIFGKFTKNAQDILVRAQSLAAGDGRPISTEYLLLAIISVAGTLSHDVLREYSVNLDQIKLVLSLGSSKFLSRSKEPMTANAREVLKLAFKIASDFGHFNVDVEHILIALLNSREFGSFQAIEKVGINPEQIKNQLLSIFNDLAEMDNMIKRQTDSSVPSERLEQPTAQIKHFANTKGKKAIDYFGVNLVERAKRSESDPVIGRDQEIDRAIQILLRRTKNNPVFIGDPGVGKTAIVEGLSQRIVKGNVPPKLNKKKIYQLDMGLLVAGTIYRGQFEDRLKKILNEVSEDKETIIFIDELHSIVGTGSAEGSMDAANILKPALSRGEIRLIGATTFDDYRKYIEKDPALERRLQPIVVKEASVEQSIEILKGIKPVYEKHHGVRVSAGAIDAAVNLSSKYLHDRFLPDKAIDLLDEALSSKSILISNKKTGGGAADLEEKIERVVTKKESLIEQEKFEEAAKAKIEESKLRDKISEALKDTKETMAGSLSESDIAALVSRITGIPVGDLIQGEAQKFLKIEKELSRHIAGQNKAISELANSLRRSRSGFGLAEKPIGSFIFLGPSGVGKTEVARVLAKEIFSSEKALIKIDMSEFMERHNLARLTGAPPGYVGYEDAGKLTETVRKQPYSVILFDEIEKAHPDIFNILLQILDEGKLTDAKGRGVDFRNTIIIMTSNIGIEEYRQIRKIGFGRTEKKVDSEDLKGVLSDKLFEFFRPELINRVDKVIVFDPLTKEDLRKIAQIQIEKIKASLARQNVNAVFTKRAVNALVDKSHDPLFGARPLIRLISDEIENLLSEIVLKGNLRKGLTVDYKNSRFTAR